MGLLKNATFVCIDCETTGLDLENDQIIEVAAVIFTLEQDLEIYDTLVDPKVTISENSMAIHHITQEMVQGKPLIGEVLPKILKMIGKHIIVGHGIAFDIHMIHRDSKKNGLNSTINANLSFDTLRMARLYGESPLNSLKNLGQHFNIDHSGAHRALNDVMVNIEVFRKLVVQYKSVEQLQKMLERPIFLKKMPLGKHKGRDLKEVPLDYLKWAAGKDFDQDLSFSIRTELKRRQSSKDFTNSSNPFSGL